MSAPLQVAGNRVSRIEKALPDHLVQMDRVAPPSPGPRARRLSARTRNTRNLVAAAPSLGGALSLGVAWGVAWVWGDSRNGSRLVEGRGGSRGVVSETLQSAPPKSTTVSKTPVHWPTSFGGRLYFNRC